MIFSTDNGSTRCCCLSDLLVQPDSKYEISIYKSNYKTNSTKIRPDQPNKTTKYCELTKSGHK